MPLVVCVDGVDAHVSTVRRRVIIMLKYPRLGAMKTRLLSALGEYRACELYRALVAHTVAEATKLSVDSEGPGAIGVRVADAPDESAARGWLGSVVSIRGEGDGNLGERRERAIVLAFAEDAEAVVVMRGDWPQFTATHLARAFAPLAQADTVRGPASGGGYYGFSLLPVAACSAMECRPGVFSG
ncbi:MAG: hypothetical protein CK548_06215 [Opitutia bacterium]|nr:DUF2064 domain-containing protein [Opitutaceae bacterium]PHX71672.1 MAG: hypothetical protein CK548_06215 [Opitutae bacterium]